MIVIILIYRKPSELAPFRLGRLPWLRRAVPSATLDKAIKLSNYIILLYGLMSRSFSLTDSMLLSLIIY